MALPIDFITRTRALLGNEFDSFEAALQADVPVSIRINEKKGAPIPAADTPDNRVAWCDTGYYLPERLSFTLRPVSSMPAPTTCRKRRPCFSNK